MSVPLARLPASAPRRVLAGMILSTLALLLLWIAVTVPAGAGWRLAMGAAGGLVGIALCAMWSGTRGALELREEGLVLPNGRLLAAMAEIRGVDRGMFAMKPSNGFVLRLASARRPAWVPGLYWRFGRRLGVGGITEAGASRAMADILSIRLAGRDA